MISDFTHYSKNYIFSILSKAGFKNPYLHVDLLSFGFVGDNYKCLIQTHGASGKIVCILYIYYNSLQLLNTDLLDEDDLEEIRMFIINENFLRVSGPTDLLKSLKTGLNAYIITNGHILKFSGIFNGPISRNNVYVCKKEDAIEISKLLLSDNCFNKSYSSDSLQAQIYHRIQNSKYESFAIKCNDKIVSHFGVYAKCDNVAILSGMVTHPEYRGKGFGSCLVKTLSVYLLNLNIQPFIYCYEEYYLSWYEKQGYSIIGESSKLELARK